MMKLREYQVTVVIANYNKELYISQCIESVLNQSLKNIEIIIVDDGSTDESGTISNRYAAKYPHITYIKQENQGVSAARNRGIQEANGKYVAFLDADDYVPADAYDTLYKLAEENEAEIAIGNFECFNEYRTWKLAYMKKVFQKNLPTVRHITADEELHLTPSASNKLFKQEFLLHHSIQFYPGLSVGEDLLFTQESLQLANRTALEDKVVLNYRVNDEEETLSKQANIRFFNQLLTVQKELTILYKKIGRESFLKPIEKRQLSFYMSSIFNKGPNLPDENLRELVDISEDFIYTLTNQELLHELDSKHILAAEMIRRKDYESFAAFLSSFSKDLFVDEIVEDEGAFYHVLAQQFPAYKDVLLVENLEIEQRIEVVKLKEGQLTLGGYAFIKGLTTKRNQKELLFVGKHETKVVPLAPQLRTDVSYLFANNQIDYSTAGFKNVLVNTVDFLKEGKWKVKIRIHANGTFVDAPVKVILAQLRNYAKTNVTNGVEVGASYNKQSEMTLVLKKVSALGNVKSKLAQWKKSIRYDLSFLKAKDYHTFSAILLYKLFHRFYKHKHIWLIGEREDTAQDNSYHLFKYLRTHQKKTNSYYVIDKKSDDYQFIKQYGNVIDFNSLKHTFYLLVCEKTINSYAETANMYTDSYKKIMKYYPEWQKNQKDFIQHGVIGVSRVNHVLHKNRMNYSHFVVSSPFEKEHVVKEFGYDESEVIVTGLPRWDALEDISKGNEILVMPTWRSWLKTEQQLFDSEYWQRYMSLLNNERFHQLLEKKDLTVTFFPHYQMQKLIGTFPEFHPRIKVVKQGEETVQHLLKRHALLLTDYSTVSFDFAYMDKPVLFYQFDYDDFYSKHYNEGPINHKKDLFGERVETEAEVIELLEAFPHVSTEQHKKIENYVVKPINQSHSQLVFQQIGGENKQ